MSKREYIARHNLILKKLQKNAATFEEINGYLQRESELQEYNFTVSKRTFQRDLNEIRLLYNTDIQYDKKRRVYFIAEQENHDLNNRMLEAFDMFHSLNVTAGLSEFIYFESRRPQGTEHFHGLLHAIKNQFLVRFGYHKFWEDEPSQRIAAPLALKECRGRWYILAEDQKDHNIKTFGLDRLAALEITAKRFNRPAGFSAEAMYRYSFGIINPTDSKPEEMLLSFTPIQGKYLKSYPLHHSQQILADNHTELLLKLNLQITHDFVMELLSFGEELKIIAPKSLKREISDRHENALKRYQ